jgi:hypothetical protein
LIAALLAVIAGCSGSATTVRKDAGGDGAEAGNDGSAEDAPVQGTPYACAGGFIVTADGGEVAAADAGLPATCVPVEGGKAGVGWRAVDRSVIIGWSEMAFIRPILRFEGKLALNCFVIEGGEIAIGDDVALVNGRACAQPSWDIEGRSPPPEHRDRWPSLPFAPKAEPALSILEYVPRRPEDSAEVSS